MKQDVLKAKIKERYGKIALNGNSDCCSTPQDCCNTTDFNPKSSSVAIGYDNKALDSIPESSIVGVGCGAPLNFANLKTGEIVVDLGSGAGIDAFLASKQVKGEGKVIGIDFTDDMLQKARNAAIKNGFSNVEFRKGDIEDKIPVENNSVDAVISNCVINLTTDKVKTFKEIYRILKKDGQGRIIISDLITSEEVHGESINSDDWCSCIDGALTKDNYINCIKQAGFQDFKILNEHTYLTEGKTDGRKITSIIVGAITK
ncbi:MAG: arsenite methyltransferase [Thaumarchaeota archaeon]|nr:MAG: arsenite methyltransferase [Nitrososphaerota archaeon]TLX92347.1 MAG: arsenite methyltransferase [Nitrososphaerota archaeon]